MPIMLQEPRGHHQAQRKPPADKLTSWPVTELHGLAENTGLLGQRQKQERTHSNRGARLRRMHGSPSLSSHRVMRADATCTQSASETLP